MTLLDHIAATLAAGMNHVEDLDARFLLPALALQLGSLVLRSLVWRNVLAAAYADRQVPVVSVAASYAAGSALNAFTPARGGDAAKILLVRTCIAGSTLATIAASFSVLLMLDGVISGTLVSGLWAFGVLPALPTVPSVDALWLVLAGLVPVGLLVAFVVRPGLVRSALDHVVQGLAIVRAPRRYLTTVVPLQLGAWLCRLGVVFLVLAAFHIHVGIETAMLLVVLNGLATAVPIPGGGGTQQVLAAYVLHGVASVAQAISFSVGLQLAVTIVNTAGGLVAMALLVRARHPLAAVRSSVALARSRRPA
ncbi:MAG TPA: lysylphosphatidylglycerol synthase domain-containing protein [Gaiellaceae bacterium]|nr:lysylphosphatidylglycerol synthase domain-containing protein [Gaiellaceae bacterium]